MFSFNERKLPFYHLYTSSQVFVFSTRIFGCCSPPSRLLAEGRCQLKLLTPASSNYHLPVITYSCQCSGQLLVEGVRSVISDPAAVQGCSAAAQGCSAAAQGCLCPALSLPW